MQARKFVCQVCDHVYDEALGDAWVCPDRGATKADFKVAECALS